MAFSDTPWQPAATARADIPAAARDWLLDPDSLTAKLKSRCQDFRVQLLRQQDAPVTADEARWLGNPQATTVREVILWCDEQPWVFARSVFAHTDASGQLQLNSLGTRPLGEHLFSQPDLQRSAIEVAAFEPTTVVGALHQQLGFRPHPLWGRRSCFTAAGQAILVAEVFIGATPFYQEIAHEPSRDHSL
ncbi:chorismate--pyruvate lyase family protein [Pseudidiomarina salinarum]|uniref:chorismate--pyruvate lyase family protein n=1 Tax=Pseudidiomarina salinarum TaxID=435908 RepID=UPI00068A1ADB|nr:chorismate lyase [Pseudidiomarina salinarum]RUO71170.1 chorismate lyase [Pseudidiomarina salinarum]